MNKQETQFKVFEMSVNLRINATILELINDLNSYFEPIVFGAQKVFIINNQRVFNLMEKRVLNPSNFETEYYKYLDYGLVIFLRDNQLLIYNDIYGAYPLFKKQKSGQIYELTNFFPQDEKFNIDELSIINLIHFNHTLEDRTIYRTIKRIGGGNKIRISTVNIRIVKLFTWNIVIQKLLKHSLGDASYQLADALIGSLNREKNVSLTLTGGFDSRLLLSVMLSEAIKFRTITWGVPQNLQSSTAKLLSDRFGLIHSNVSLDRTFTNKIEWFLSYISRNSSGSPFIVDIPQFIYLCQQLCPNENLVSGFMGSEIVRGPSYSSQVTLTKFAAEIAFCSNKKDIKNTILLFNQKYPYLKNEIILKYMDKLIELYGNYAQFGASRNLRNSNIFKYLFFEKYAKIYGNIINYHCQFNVNLINPYMDFKFIAMMFQKNKALTKMTPYRSNSIKNFNLYRFYANEIRKLYPDILHTKLDRGYHVNDLISIFGILKLIPLQGYRKIKKKRRKVIKVVDSFSWYEQILNRELIQENQLLSNIINYDKVRSDLRHSEKLNDFEKLKLQIILGTILKFRYSK